MKKALITLLTVFTASYADNCQILGEIFDNCVKNQELKTCKDRGIALYYSLKARQIDENVARQILKYCEMYCLSPNIWNKQAFVKACQTKSKSKNK